MAHARDIVVCLEPFRGAWVRLNVTDDGVGFEVDGVTGDSGFGLTSMRERTAGLGGDFRVSSAPGRGTRVEVVIPAG